MSEAPYREKQRAGAPVPGAGPGAACCFSLYGASLTLQPQRLTAVRTSALQLVLEAMRSQPSSLRVQLVASACVFSLSTRDLAQALPPPLLAAAAHQLLLAMQSFPGHAQVPRLIHHTSSSLMFTYTYHGLIYIPCVIGSITLRSWGGQTSSCILYFHS